MIAPRTALVLVAALERPLLLIAAPAFVAGMLAGGAGALWACG